MQSSAAVRAPRPSVGYVPAGNIWSEPVVARLKQLVAEGLSCSQVAKQLNREFGTTFERNAVIGKKSRLGLPSPKMQPKAPVTALPKVKSAPVPVPAPPVVAPEPEPLPPSPRVSILELRDGVCRWPFGDPQREGFGFCGARCDVTLPYCGAHCRIAYVPVKPKARLAGQRAPL